MNAIKYILFLMLVPLFMASGFVSAWVGWKQDGPYNQDEPPGNVAGPRSPNDVTRQQLEKQFDRDMARRQQQLTALKQRLADAEATLQKRQLNRESIIELRWKMIQAENEGLGWPKNQNANDPFNGGVPRLDNPLYKLPGDNRSSDPRNDPYNASPGLPGNDPFSAGPGQPNKNPGSQNDPFSDSNQREPNADPFGLPNQNNPISDPAIGNQNRNPHNGPSGPGNSSDNEPASRNSNQFFGQWEIDQERSSRIQNSNEIKQLSIGLELITVTTEKKQTSYKVVGITYAGRSLNLRFRGEEKDKDAHKMMCIAVAGNNRIEAHLEFSNQPACVLPLVRVTESDPAGPSQDQPGPQDKRVSPYLGEWGIILRDKDGTNPTGPHETIVIENETVKIPGMLGTKVFSVNSRTVDDRSIAFQLTEQSPKAHTAVMLCKRSKETNTLNINLISTNGEKFEWDVRRVIDQSKLPDDELNKLKELEGVSKPLCHLNETSEVYQTLK